MPIAKEIKIAAVAFLLAFLLFVLYWHASKESQPKVIISKMKKNFEEKTAIFTEDIEKQKKDTRDIIIMASLLEEEAALDKDRKLISGILWKRITLGMLLQVDAALTYATGRSSRKLTDDDL